MYQIAEENGVENLVAGAWGCGVFMQDPYTVATLLIGAARNYNIPNIYFAIPRILEHDLNMSPGISFGKDSLGKQRSGSIMYHMDISLDTDLFHDWITGAETKVVCRAKNKDDLLRAVEAAKELGMEEYKDYFLIYDACRTELEKESPEGTLTCIGFRPMEAEEIKKYQLYH